jgi:hypothetical protein
VVITDAVKSRGAVHVAPSSSLNVTSVALLFTQNGMTMRPLESCTGAALPTTLLTFSASELLENTTASGVHVEPLSALRQR